MNKLNFTSKNNGDILNASEWNSLVAKTDEIVTAINNGGIDSSSEGGTPVAIDTNGVISVNNKNNTVISSAKHINFEPAYVENGGEGTYGDIQFKPGDDVTFESHHRTTKKRGEITIKTSNGQSGDANAPVKLQFIASALTLSTKGKKEDPNVMDVNVTTGNGKGYLKVRAQAIDLRSETHGGIALQPRGKDSDNHENKIKFEHGGGDGLEFGTFNTEKTSIFTDEYRFNKAGVWKMATRQKLDNTPENGGNDKYTGTNVDDTTHFSYKKQEDDFYDIITPEDAQTTTEAIIKSAAALNNDFIETSLSSKNNLKISASSNYKIVAYEDTPAETPPTFADVDKTTIYTKEQLKSFVSGSTKLSDLIDTKLPFQIDGEEHGAYFRLSGNITPKISLEAEEEVGLEAKYGDVVLTSGDTIKMEAPEIRLDAVKDDKTGGFVNFGATNDVIFINSKLTKSLNVEGSSTPTTIRQVVQNNTQDTVYWNESTSKFIVPLKKIYTDAEHTTELTDSNYAENLPVYFADGTQVPAGYSCFIGVTTGVPGSYITDVYKMSTKDSAGVLGKSKNFTHVVQYTQGDAMSLGTPDNNNLSVEYVWSNHVPVTGAIAPETFKEVASVDLADIIEIVNELKTMKTNEQGPWARQASSGI